MLSTDDIAKSFYKYLKSCLSGSLIMVVINDQFSEAQKINADTPQRLSLLGLTHFLLYINNLPKTSHRSLVNIHANDTMIYG